MIYYEVLCYSCKKIFRVYEGTLEYKLFKEKRAKYFAAKICKHKIHIEAIKNFFR